MSMFDRLDRIASREVDRAYADRFTLTPMLTSPNGRPGPDPDRPIIEGRGIFDLVPAFAPIEQGARSTSGGGNALRSLVAGEEPSLSVDRSVFAGAEPRQGDRIDFPDHSSRGGFEVVECRRDGMSRVLLRLAKAG